MEFEELDRAAANANKKEMFFYFIISLCLKGGALLKGKNIFTESEVEQIKDLLKEKEYASSSKQKVIRVTLRQIGFYISDFDTSQRGFSMDDFDYLISSGAISIIKQNKKASLQYQDILNNSIAIETQRRREHYKPKVIKVLFVGESPPYGRTFFYYANSNLYHCIQEAFSSVYGDQCGKGDGFLEFFSNNQCYLDDLCLEPVNKKPSHKRDQLRQKGVGPLSQRISMIKPKAVVIVMKGIESQVKSAIHMSGWLPTFVETTTFPAFSNNNKRNCVFNTSQVLTELIEIEILSNPSF